MPRYLEIFVEMLLAERGAAANTVDSYSRDLRHFSDWLVSDIASAGTEDIRGYLNHLAKHSAAPSTAARRLSAIRQYYRFLQAEELRADDPSAIIDSPKQGRSLPRVLSEEEVDRLLTAARDFQGIDAPRIIALMEILYATGLRVSELVGLPLASARPEQSVIIVKGKVGRERLVPLSEPAQDALRDYLRHRAEKTIPVGREKWLFPSRAKGGFLTRQRFSQLLKELAVQAGIDPTRVHAHGLRHAFASHLLAHGADLRAVQQMLGHADISTTQIYTHVLDERLRHLVENHHPLAQK